MDSARRCRAFIDEIMAPRFRAYCSVYGCLNTSISKPKISFFKLPTQSERLSEWLRLICREDLANKAKIKGYQICEEHFNVRDILPTSNRKLLKKNALPSLSLPDLQSTVQEGSRKEDKQTQTENATRDSYVQTTKNISCNTPRKRKLKFELVECRKKLRLYETENKTDKAELKRSEHSQDKSIYLYHNVQTVDSDYVAESYWESYTCNECNDVIKNGRFACAQCVDYDLCAQCAGERAAHRQHYLLRVPPRRPPDEVQRVLQTIRSILESEGATVALPADGSEDKQTDTIKKEIKEEVDIFEEPLACDVKQDDCETLKRVIVITQSNDIEYTTKRKKRKTRDVTSAAPGTPQSSLVGRATAAADSTVPSVVKQEHEPSLRTPTITPSVPPPLIPAMPAVMYTSTQDEAEMALQAIRPTWKIGRTAVTLPANESEGEQTVPCTSIRQETDQHQHKQ